MLLTKSLAFQKEKAIVRAIGRSGLEINTIFVYKLIVFKFRVKMALGLN